jgi:hypothetical protein
MAIKLFDDCARDAEGPCRHGEPGFAYLNRSSRRECDELRCLLEQWFSRYPAQKQSQLRGRFRDLNSDRNHFSAFYELLVHELLLCLGCRVFG